MFLLTSPHVPPVWHLMSNWHNQVWFIPSGKAEEKVMWATTSHQVEGCVSGQRLCQAIMLFHNSSENQNGEKRKGKRPGRQSSKPHSHLPFWWVKAREGTDCDAMAALTQH